MSLLVFELHGYMHYAYIDSEVHGEFVLFTISITYNLVHTCKSVRMYTVTIVTVYTRTLSHVCVHTH